MTEKTSNRAHPTDVLGKVLTTCRFLVPLARYPILRGYQGKDNIVGRIVPCLVPVFWD